MKKFTIVLIVFLLCMTLCFESYGQGGRKYAITGRTCNEQKENIEYSTVMLISKKDTLKVFGTVSDGDGKFTLSAPKDEYTLCVEYVGYEQNCQDITLDSNIEVGDIVLKEAPIGIDAVVVKANLVTRESDRFVVNVSGSAMAIGKTATEMLNIAPGVWVHDGISINGRDGTRVMINDRLLKETGEDLVNYLNTIKAEDIKKIEVIPYAGADYDANMTGGIVKITLTRQREDGLNGSASMRFDRNFEWAYNNISPSFNLNYKTGKVSLYTNIGYNSWGWHGESHETTQFLNSDNHIDTRTRAHNDDSYNYHGRLGAIYEIDKKQSVEIETDMGLNRNKNLTLGNSNYFENQSITTSIGKYDNRNNANRFGLSGNYILNLDTVGSSFKLLADYYRTNNNERDNYNTEYIGLQNNDSTYINSTITQNTMYSVTANFDFVLDKNTTVKTGGKYTHNEMYNDLSYDFLGSNDQQWHNIPSQSSINQYMENIGALYINFSTKLKDRIGINLGLRGEYTNVNPSTSSTIMTEKQNYFGLFPNANISIPVNKNADNMFIVNYSRKIERPSFWQLNPYKTVLSEYSSIQGNPKLKPVYKNNVSLAFVLNNKYTFTAGATISQNTITQIGVVDPNDTEKILYQFQNLKNERSFLIAANIPTDIFKWWRLNMNLTGMHSKNNTNGMEFTQNSFIGNMNNIFTLCKDTYLEFNTFYISGFLSGNLRIKSYYNLDASIKRNFAKGKFTASVFINNITNRNNRIRATIIGSDFIRHMDVWQNWQAVGISLRYNFKKGKEIKVKNIETGAAEDKSRM